MWIYSAVCQTKLQILQSKLKKVYSAQGIFYYYLWDEPTLSIDVMKDMKFSQDCFLCNFV